MIVSSLMRCMPALVIGLAMSVLGVAQSTEQVKVQKEGIELIKQVEDAARDIRYNADRLNAFSKSTLTSKWSHYHHLNEIRNLVNDGLQPAFKRLSEIQVQLPAWKQQSIDSMMESAKTLAADANSAILNKADSGAVPAPLNAEYKRLISTIYQHADTLVKSADAAEAYATEKLKAEGAVAQEK